MNIKYITIKPFYLEYYNINYNILKKYNPFINVYKNSTINKNFERLQYNYYDLLEEYPYIFDYITSKQFYKVIIYNKFECNKQDTIWDMLLNINPYSEPILTEHIELVDYDWLSLNPNCFDIYNKIIEYDNDMEYNYLNDDLLSANPIILTYIYDYIYETNNKINHELITEMYHPKRIKKYLEKHHIDTLDNYLN